MAQQVARSRPAHPNGPTYLSYTPDGTKLITVGTNTAARIFQHKSDAEPGNIDECHDANLAVVATNDHIITGSEDGVVAKYSLRSKELERLLVRCSLPIRDLALSPDGEWVAVASDELAVKIVNVNDAEVIYVRDQPKPAKHVSWRTAGEPMLTVSCTDGSIYIYEIHDKEANLVKRLPALIKAQESDSEATTNATWHPDGTAFAVPLPTKDVQVISQGDWEMQRTFRNGHTGDITAMNWSPNGALLATAGLDRTIQVWDTKTQKIVTSVNGIPGTVLSLAWHLTDNVLSYTCSTGELFIQEDIVPPAYRSLVEMSQQSAPFIHNPLSEVSGNAQRQLVNGLTKNGVNGSEEATDPLDDLLGPDSDEEEDFIVDDDGQGYAEPMQANGHRKRTNNHLGDIDRRHLKRRPAQDTWKPRIHPTVQPGSTPWRGNKRYLCLNLVGSVWTVDNYENGDDNKYHTITVTPWDTGYYQEYHFPDYRFYDKACLNENGALFSCPPSEDGVTPATIYYRPHEYWTAARPEFHISLPEDERVVALSMSTSYITVVTSASYVRVYTLYGVPYRVYRQKSSPAVACTSWREYVLTISNGSLTSSGRPQLVYTIENVKHDDVLQADDIVALPDGEELRSVFFSEDGDPYIYDSTGTLLVLLHWRTPGQARWVPVLDTKLLDRLADGKKDEKYWPVGVSMNKFYCIILKGMDTPHHQKPLLSDFNFCVPLHGKPEASMEEGSQLIHKLQESFVRESVLYDLLEDAMPAKGRSGSQEQSLASQCLAINKALIQLLANEVSGGDDHGMKALEIVALLRDDRDGRMMDAARKIAQRKELTVLEDKIIALQDRRVAERDGWAL